MNESDKEILRTHIAPLLERGELSLLLGAGFSITNTVAGGLETLPGGDALKELLLKKCGKTPGPKTTLKDAYQFAKTKLANEFDAIFASFFSSDLFCFKLSLFFLSWLTPHEKSQNQEQYTFACGNQTVFNQFSLTCSHEDEAVPCNQSPDFYYLNELLYAGPEAVLHTDQDVERAALYGTRLSSSSNAKLQKTSPNRETESSDTPAEAEKLRK